MSVDRKNIKGKAQTKQQPKSQPKSQPKVQTKVVKSYPDKKKSEKINASQCELCGGCLGTTESYEKYIFDKQVGLKYLIGDYCDLEPMIQMENPYYYRNKVFSVFQHVKEGTVCGVYKPELRKVISLDECTINNKKATAIINTIRDLLKSFKIKTYDPRTGHGLLRYVLVREAKSTGEIMVVLVLSSHIMPSKNNFIKALREIHPEIETIIINENYKATEKLLGDKETVIFGKGFLLDTIAEKKFRVSSKSIYPINTIQMEALCHKVIEFAECSEQDVVLDTYCGIGTSSIMLSDYAKKIISVDAKTEVIRDAVANVKRNKIKNVDFYTNDPANFILQIVNSEKQKPNIVILNAPKRGCSTELLNALVLLKAEKLVYLSKNTHTMLTDLKYLKEHGYQMKKAVGVDMLPWTENLETICLLERKFI